MREKKEKTGTKDLSALCLVFFVSRVCTDLNTKCSAGERERAVKARGSEKCLCCDRLGVLGLS